MNLPRTRFAGLTRTCALACSIALWSAARAPDVVAAQAAPSVAPNAVAPNAQLAPMPPKPAPVPNAQIRQPRPAPAPITPQLVPAPAPAPAAGPGGAATPAPAHTPAPEGGPASVPPAESPAPATSAPAVPPAPPVVQAPPPNYPPNGYPPPPAYDPRYGAYPAYPGYPPPGPRLSRGLMITGISILGGTYGVSLLLGLIATSEGASCSDCDEVGPPLFLPVFGPFIAAGQSDSDDDILMILGMGQLVGAGLTIGGVIKYKNSKKRAEQQGYVVELARGRTLALDVATSPELTSARMQLNF